MSPFRNLAACVLVVGATLPLRGSDTCAERRFPVLLIGLDGFEWRIALPLLHQGRLPEIAALIESGSCGTLRTLRPTVSPALWTTIATGKRFGAHGIHGFLRTREPEVLYTSLDRRTKAFWNILSDAGRTSHTVGWWLTFPVERVQGVMVAQSNTLQDYHSRGLIKGTVDPRLPDQVYPSQQQEAFFHIVADVDRDLPLLVESFTRGVAGGAPPPAGAALALEESRWSLRADAIHERATLELSRRAPADLTAVYFGLTDVVGHRFWRYGGPWLEPETAEYRFEGWSSVIPAAYERADAMIGRLRRALPGATVILVSDHGMRPAGHGDGPEAFLLAAGPGIRTSPGPGAARTRLSDIPRLGSILDVLPTALALLGVPAARDLEGQPLPVLRPEVLAARPEPIASYDTAEWQTARAALRGEQRPSQDPERLEQLRALGYIN